MPDETIPANDDPAIEESGAGYGNNALTEEVGTPGETDEADETALNAPDA